MDILCSHRGIGEVAGASGDVLRPPSRHILVGGLPYRLGSVGAGGGESGSGRGVRGRYLRGEEKGVWRED